MTLSGRALATGRNRLVDGAGSLAAGLLSHQIQPTRPAPEATTSQVRKVIGRREVLRSLYLALRRTLKVPQSLGSKFEESAEPAQEARGDLALRLGGIASGGALGDQALRLQLASGEQGADLFEQRRLGLEHLG